MNVGGGWEVLRLDEVAEVKIGLAKRSSSSPAGGHEVVCLGAGNVQDGYFDLVHLTNVIISQQQLDAYSLQPGDVLLTMGGAAGSLGRGTVWSGDITPCVFQNHVAVLRANRRRVLPEFLSGYAGSSAARAYFSGHSLGVLRLQHLRRDDLAGLPVPVPPLPLQARIAELVAAMDAVLALDWTALARLQAARNLLPRERRARRNARTGEAPDHKARLAVALDEMIEQQGRRLHGTRRMRMRLVDLLLADFVPGL